MTPTKWQRTFIYHGMIWTLLLCQLLPVTNLPSPGPHAVPCGVCQNAGLPTALACVP